MKRRLCMCLLFCLNLPVLAEEFSVLLTSFGNLETIAGLGSIRGKGVNGWQLSMEGQPATLAELSRPHIAMADASGNIFIADKDAHAIRLVSPDLTIHTLAGTGVSGFNGDGPGTTTLLSEPNGLYTFPDGTCYILDLGNARIRKMSPPDNERNTEITTILHDPDGMGVGRGLWVSPSQDRILYVSFHPASASSCVKQWTPQDGISLVASGLAEPGNLDVHPQTGAVYVTDRARNRVYRIEENATLTPVAGNGLSYGGGDGQPAINSALLEVRGIFFTPNGGYFVCTHAGGQVWYVDTLGIIHLFVDGSSSYIHAGDGLPVSSPGKKLSEPRAVTLAPNGDLLITESDYGYVRRVKRAVQLIQATPATDSVILTWSSVSGRIYSIEHAAHPTPGSWQTLAQYPGTGASITTSVAIARELLGPSGSLRLTMQD